MNGYYLYRGNSLESFPDDHPGLFLQKTPLSEPVWVVVQNSGLGEWLTRRLAARTGGIMGMRTLVPEQALRRFAGGFAVARSLVSPDGRDPGYEDSTLTRGEGRGLLFMDGMKLTVFKALEEVLAGDDPLFAPLRNYTGAGGSRTWQLSDALAGIFYHYGMNCLPLVEDWEEGRSFPGLNERQREDEAWQRSLWRRIFHDGAPYIHLSKVLSGVMNSKDAYDGPPARIVLFGSMFLGETGLKFFRHLASFLEVHHFVFTPAELPPGEVPEVPLLKNNGRLSSGFNSLLPDLSPHRITVEDHGGEPASLIERVRQDLSQDRPLSGNVMDDGSMAIHDAVGVRRQVEVLKDRILEALRDDPSLAPTDIGVLAPDIASWAPVIDSVFPGRDAGGRDGLPYNLSDLPGRIDAPYSAAFAALTALPGAAFGRMELLGLFRNPCFAPVAGDANLAEAWEAMADELNVRWGVDAGHRRDDGAADPRTGTWDLAFGRLLEAYCRDEGDDPDLLPARLSGDNEAEAAGRLIRAVRGLDADLRGLDGPRRSLREWTLKWERIIDTWLRPRKDVGAEEDEADRLRIKGAIRDLMALDEDLAGLSDYPDGTIPWSAFSSLLEEMTGGDGGRRGRYLARGVTCASLKPMRAIPFRRIYLLGLDEGAWPGREYLTGFDLRESVPRAIDLSREAVDRFAFLETLYAASDHLSFFFTGRDPERGEPVAPASPLSELCEYIGPDWKNLLRVHPLVPYDPAALGGDSRLATSSAEALALAESRQRGPDPAPGPDSGMAVPPDDESVDWNSLVRFLGNPLRFYYGDVLDASREYGPADEREHDILEPEFLDWWGWKSSAVTDSPGDLSDPDRLVAGFRRRMELEGTVAVTPLLRLSEAGRAAEAEALADQYRRILREGLDPSPGFSILLDPAADGPEGTAEPGGELRIPAPTIQFDDGGSLTVTGRIGGLNLLDGGGSRIWTMTEFISGHQVKARHRLRGWMAALLIGAAMGEAGPAELRIFRLGGRDLPARRFYFPQDSAAAGGSVSGSVGGSVSEAVDGPVDGSVGGPVSEAAGGSGDRCLLSDPGKLLETLARIRRASMSRPLMLHPDLAEELGTVERKKGPLSGDELVSAAESAWRKILDNDRGFSGLKDCPFRRRFVGTPDFTTSIFSDAWAGLYREGGIL